MPRKKLRKQLEELTASLQDRWPLECEWQSKNCLTFQHSSVQGEIEIGKHEFELNAELGALMSVFKNTIEDEIDKFIDQHVY
ncbi:MAG: polyhydroxyalkanoic acid system family protein [Chromatiales bacterium]|nr:MAG: polyhydroxyalkanoic acid system family protein [Chromatiales bacterium]